MRHNRKEVIQRAIQEYRLLDRQVSGLTQAEWRKPVPRPETKERWTVKDSLAHITFWKEGVLLSARGERRPPIGKGLNMTQENHVIFKRYHARSAREILAWHRQVQADLLKALRQAPDEWFTRPSRSKDWPFDIDGHSAAHRLRDIEGALAKPKPKTKTGTR